MDISRLAKSMKRQASSGTWNGREPTQYFARCRWVRFDTGTLAMFTRDTGHHSSGWWKNPDYERCWHLSLSFFDRQTLEPKPRDAILTALYVDTLFGTDKRWLWCEPPYSEEGKKRDVWHYRLFADIGWHPIKPRGEVYSRELTEAGWKSFSDVEADLTAASAAACEQLGNIILG